MWSVSLEDHAMEEKGLLRRDEFSRKCSSLIFEASLNNEFVHLECTLRVNFACGLL